MLKKRLRVFGFLIIIFLLFPLWFLVKQAQKKQIIIKQAQGPEYLDEVTSSLPFVDLEVEDGILAPKEEIDKYLIGKKSLKFSREKIKEVGLEASPLTAEGSGGTGRKDGGEASRLTLPSVSAFSSNLQTGVAQVSYPIAVFPGLGGLTPSVSLVYSSSNVDDMRLYQMDSTAYNVQAGIAGLGWEIGGISYIARDTSTHPDSFHLVFAGGSTKIFRREGSSEWFSDWQSNPKLFIKIHHLPNNHYQYYDTNTWTITTQDGTVYIFGSPINNDGAPLDEALTPLTLTKGFGSCEENATTTGIPYKWYLREVRDLNGNKIVYEYDKDWAPNYYGACESRGFTTYTYLKRVKYNFKNGDPKTIIEFNYEPRPDIYTIGRIRYSRQICQQTGRSDCKPGEVQYKEGDKRLKEIKVLVDGSLARKYVLNYELSSGQGEKDAAGRPASVNYHPGHSLLKEIKQFGTDERSSLPPYAFSYAQLGSLNEIYLKTANNGYGGEFVYEYSKKTIPFCDSNGSCGENGDFGSSKYVVSKIIVNDGEGNSFEKTYEYTTPKAYVEKLPDSSAVDACNSCKDSCPGTCNNACSGVAQDQKDQCINQCISQCQNYCSGGKGNFCGYPNPFSGFEFLGFGQVTERLSSINNPRVIESSSRAFFHQVLEKKGCFEKDPRQGRAYKTEVLGSEGAVLTTSEYFYEPERTNESCRSDKTQWEKESVFVKLTQVNNIQVSPSIGNKVTAVKNYYNDTYGLVTRVENFGEVKLTNPNDHRQFEDIPGDETYSFTTYIANEEKWVVKPKETWISDSAQGTPKYNHTYYYYDGNDRYYPAPTKLLEKGLLTRTSIEDDRTYGSVKRIISNFEYNTNGQLKKTIDPMGYVTEIFYDNNKIGVFPVAVKNPLGQISRTQYSNRDYLLGQPTITIDIAGRKTKIEYDTFGRVLKVFNPDDNDPTQPEFQPSIRYEYFDSLRKPYIRIYTKVFEGNYQVVDKIYNGLGQLLQDQVLSTFVDERQEGIKEEKGIISETKYNSRGQIAEASLPVVVNRREPTAPPTKITLPTYKKTITTYDQLGRVVAVTDPLGRTSRTEYLNFTTTNIDAAGHRTISETDGLGRVKFTLGYQGDFGSSSGKRIETRTTYDVLGNPLITTQTFPDSSGLGPFITRATYDLLGRKLTDSDPDLGMRVFEYDNKGRLIKQIDAKNQEIRFEYDQLDRLRKKIYPRKPYPEALRNFVEYQYDNQCGEGANALGQKCRTDDLIGSTVWEYDKKGRVVKVTKVIDRIITGRENEVATYEYTYFSTNQIKTFKYPGGEILTYTYDKYGNQQAVAGNDQYLSEVTSNKFGSPTKISLTNGLSQTFTYNVINQLTNLTVRNLTSVVFTANYSNYDSLGNILSVVETKGSGQSETSTYIYDSLSQLRAARISGATTANYTYQYDENGNLKVKNEDLVIEMTYNNNFPVHAPKAVKIGSGTVFTYRYDENGNLLEDEARTYNWDFDNKPIKITMKNSGRQVLFYYDGDGERVVKKEVGVSTIVYFPSLEKILETGEVNKYYGVGGITLQRSIKNGVEKLYYLFPDHLSSTRAIIDKDKTQTFYLSYYPYGNLKSREIISSSITNLYTGQKRDKEVDLYYYHARYYNPQTAHFISADSAQGPNRYAYVGNNPIMNNDPTGNIPPSLFLYYLMYQDAVRVGRETGSLWTSDLPVGLKLLGQADILLGHSLSNTVFAVNEADPFRGGTLSWDSGASVGERALAVGKILGNSLLLSSQLVSIGKGVSEISSVALRRGALSLYGRVGSEELLPAIKALRGKDYQTAINLAEEAWLKLEPNASGLKFKALPERYGGGVTMGGDILISSEMPLERQASLAIHEVAHKFFEVSRKREMIYAGREISTTQHYGRYVQAVFQDEFESYLAEYAGGVKSLWEVVRGFAFSTSRGTTGNFWTALKALMFER